MTDETREIAPIFGGRAVDIENSQALIDAMEETADEGGRNGDVLFMNFSGKRGRYSIGADKREPGDAEPFLVAIMSFELGWVAWKGGNPVGKRMALITQPRIMQPSADEGGPFDTNKGEGWHRARAITVRSLETEDQCYFAINSVSGVAALSDLQKDVMSRMKAGLPCWPVVTFGIEEFTAQGHKNFKPAINVVKWLEGEELLKLQDPEFDPMALLGDVKEEAPKAVEPPKRRRL